MERRVVAPKRRRPLRIEWSEQRDSAGREKADGLEPAEVARSHGRLDDPSVSISCYEIRAIDDAMRSKFLKNNNNNNIT